MDAEELKSRTKKFAIDVIYFLRTIKHNDEMKVIKNQLIKSSTSIAANYRAVCRARSNNEFYAKLCIVVEETDESELWLDIINETQECDKQRLLGLIKECNELINLFAKSKKTMSDKLFPKS
jgi:four helix bundle protein